MDLRCTCGAYPPEDARFCHKCGRPLLEESPADSEALTPPPLPVAADPPESVVEISFQNALAVRVSLIAAGLAVLLLGLAVAVSNPLLQILACVMLAMGSGFFAVYLYRLRSGKPVSVLSGARLGWITGVFSFVILLVLITITFLAMSDAGFRAAMQQELDKAGKPGDLQLLERPAELLLSFAANFVTLAMMTSVGGAMGAKLLGHDEPGS